MSAEARPRATREDDIRYVLLRHLVGEDEAANSHSFTHQTVKPVPTPRPVKPAHEFEPPELKFYYFSYSVRGHETDPSDQFLQRFARHKPPIKKVSESYFDENAKDFAWSAIKDKKTHELGLCFYVGDIIWLGRNRVKVGAGYEGGGLNAGSSTYWLRFLHGHWKIWKITDSVVS